MSQQRGANVTIIFDTETTFKATPGTPDAMVLPYVTESIRLNRNLIESKTNRSTRNPQMPGRGKVDVGGDINFELSPQCGRLLKHIFGDYVKTGSAAPYTHTYKIGDLPAGMVIEKQFKDLATPKFFQYNGCKINQFKCAVKPEGMIDCSVSVMGAKETIADASFDSTPTDIGHKPFDGFSGSVKQGGAAIGIVTDFNFTLDNALDGETYVLDGTGQRYSMAEGKVKLEGSIQVIFDSITLYNLAIGHTETSLELHFTFGDGLGGSSGNEKLSFCFDEIIFKPQAPVVSGPTGLQVEIPFQAFYNDDADASACRAVLLSPISTF
jgi:hypothetical protein